MIRSWRPFSFAVPFCLVAACSGDNFQPQLAGSAGAAGLAGAAGTAGAPSSIGGAGGSDSGGAAGDTGAAGSAGNAAAGSSAGSGAAGSSAGTAGSGSSTGGSSSGTAGAGSSAGNAAGGTSAGNAAAGSSAGNAAAGSSAGNAAAGSSAGNAAAGSSAGNAAAGSNSTGEAGAGGAGPVDVPCEGLSDAGSLPATGFKSCKPGFEDCLLATVGGAEARLAATTCGVAVAYRAPDSPEAISFPERGKALQLASDGDPHGLAFRGNTAVIATSGDALRVRVPAPIDAEHTYGPGSLSDAVDLAGYRSVFVGPELIAWTGRQGFPIMWLQGPTGCPATGSNGCMGSIQTPMGEANAVPPPGWGVTAIGKQIYWSHPGGVSCLDLAVDTPAGIKLTPRTIGIKNITAGSMGVAAGRPLVAYGQRLDVLSPDCGMLQTTTPLAVQAGEIVDFVVFRGAIYVLGAGATPGYVWSTALVGTLPMPVMSIVVSPATGEPSSIAVSPDAIYFATRKGNVFRIPRQP